MLFYKNLLATLPFALSASASAVPQFGGLPSTSVVNTTTCNGKTYVYNELAGYGAIPSNARDKFGDTIGGIGSSIAIDKA